MKKFLLLLYKLMFFLIPIPLFFDIGRLSIVNIKVDQYNILTDSPLIPLPIGALAFFLAILIGYACSVFYSNLFKSVFVPAKMFVFYFLVVLPLSIYSVFISNLSLPRLAQLLLPMVFISLLSFPVLLKDRLDILRNLLISSFVFFSLHFISILYNAEDVFRINDRVEFSSFYGLNPVVATA